MRPLGGGFGAGRVSWTPATPPSIDGLHILLVDDEPDGREAMAYALEDYGARVAVVASARDALLAIEAEVPDVLVSDLAMSDGDGYALIRRVRALAPDRGGRLPAVALTAHCRAEDKVRALRAGFQLHLAKPISPADLAATVAVLAGRKANNPALRRTA
jgi:CheY-like chemotaxis protein